MTKAKRKGVEIRRYLAAIDNYETKILSASNLTEDGLVSLLNKNADSIHGREFYYAIKDSGGDIDNACKEIFVNLKLPIFKKEIGTDPNKTRLENYTVQFVVQLKDIANKIETDPSTLSRFFSGEREIFAYQIYFLAKAHEKLSSEAFEFLYGPNGIGRI